MAGHHDLGYKLLFAHPELVRDLLSGFTPFAWFGALEAAAFERVNPSYVSERFDERHDDLVWRVRLGEQWLYVYILLEFQSAVDRWMALRMQVYVGLLYQDLVKREAALRHAKLPPELPLVFYNGAAAWGAGTSLSSLIMPVAAELKPYQAAQQFFLVDQQRLDPAALARNRSVLASLFRLELSDVSEVVREVLPLLATWLRADAQAPLRRDVGSWVKRLLGKKFQGAQVRDADIAEELEMGALKFETWTEELDQRGMQRGLAQGREEGLERGLEQGIEQGCAALRAILERILVRRFGVLPSGAEQRIEAASIGQLEQWIGRALEADDADAVFAPQPAAPAG